MKALIYKTTTTNLRNDQIKSDTHVVNIDTLEDLLEFLNENAKNKDQLILSTFEMAQPRIKEAYPKDFKTDFVIEIYDDYRE
jgi:hypothetical protein